MRPHFALITGLALATVSGLVLGSKLLLSPGPRPNIVVVVGCTLRKDQLTPYGGHPDATPFVDTLAKRGSRFADAFDNAGWTRASHTAIVTAHHPLEVGMVGMGPRGNRHKLDAAHTTIAEVMKRSGYLTLGLTANPHINDVFGFDQGFDRYIMGSSMWRPGPNGGTAVFKVPGTWMAEQALSNLDELRAEHDPSQPLYMQLTLTDTHGPAADVTREEFDEVMTEDTTWQVGKYRVLAQRFDRAVQELYEGLEARGFTAENTIFMVINDHGEGLRTPPHHGYRHGEYLYDSNVAMPWIAVGPGIPANREIGGMASQIDVLPTLAALTHSSLTDYDGEGISHADALLGHSPSTARTEAFVDSWFESVRKAAVFTPTVACTKDYADPEYIKAARAIGVRVIRGRTHCYDRIADPDGFEEIEAPELMARLDAWRAATYQRGEKWMNQNEVEVDDELAAQLRSLGYADPD